MKEKKALLPQCLHTIFCSTIFVLAFISAYLYRCGNDGFVSTKEMETATEYFFICITEILFFTLSIDIIYKVDNKKKG